MVISPEMVREVEQFIYREARLADESRYLDWEALVDDDMQYVVLGPGGMGSDPQVNFINDTRKRLRTRIEQLMTGRRYSQVPVSPMRRLISNMEIEQIAEDQVRVTCNFVLYELRVQSSGEMVTWPGQAVYIIRLHEEGMKIRSKTLDLITRNVGVTNMAFLI